MPRGPGVAIRAAAAGPVPADLLRAVAGNAGVSSEETADGVAGQEDLPGLPTSSSSGPASAVITAGGPEDTAQENYEEEQHDAEGVRGSSHPVTPVSRDAEGGLGCVECG